MLLQKVNSDSDKPRSGNLTKVALYIVSLVAAYLFGYYEHSRTHLAASDTPVVPAAISPASPADDAASVPLSIPQAEPGPLEKMSSPPELANEPAPSRVERAAAIEPAPSDTPAPTAVPSAAPAKQPNEVTITEPVEIPVVENGKTTGYINLQRGQVVTPIGVDHDQIKIRSGTTSLMVPIKSTDMAH